MGHMVVAAQLAGARTERVRMLVDTGATYSVLPADLAARLKITEAPRRLRVRLADGRRNSMRVGTVSVRLLGREAADTALIGPPASSLSSVPRRSRPSAWRWTPRRAS